MNNASIETLLGIGLLRSPKFHPFLSVGRSLKLLASKKYRTSPTVQVAFEGKLLPVGDVLTLTPPEVYCGVTMVPVCVLIPAPSARLLFPDFPAAGARERKSPAREDGAKGSAY